MPRQPGSAGSITGPLDHDGAQVGFYGAEPVARPAAYTQTFGTATRTHANLTSAVLTNNLDITTVDGVLEDIDGLDTVSGAAVERNFSECADQIAKLRADLSNVKQLLNQVIDDLQAVGLFQ